VLYEEARHAGAEKIRSPATISAGLLAAENHPAEAVTNLAIALQANRPSMAEIHFELGRALARLGAGSRSAWRICRGGASKTPV